MRTPLLMAALVGFLASPRADAQVRFLPYVGYQTNVGYDINDDDPEDFGDVTGAFLVGVGAEFGLTPGILPIGLSVRPSVETAFLSGFDEEIANEQVEISQNTLQASLDLIGSFSPPLSPVGVYAGAGVTYVSYSAETSVGGEVEAEDDGSSVGANLLLGVRFGGGFVAPFVQGRYTLANPTPDVLDDDGDDDNDLGNSIAVQAGVSIGL